MAVTGPTMIFDGDCAFCTRCAEWLSDRVAQGVFVVPWQHTDLAACGITAERVAHEAVWVDPRSSGAPEVRGGARAIAAALRHCDAPAWRAAGRILDAWPARPLARPVYRLIARYRHRLPGGSPACAIRPAVRTQGRAE